MSNNLKLIITRTAYNDMHQIFDYIAKDNKNAASKLLNVFQDKFEIILAFPDSGFKPKFSSKEIRVYIVAKHYQIVYSIKKNEVYILRVLTGYQDIFY